MAKAKVRDDVTEAEARAVVQKYQDAERERQRIERLQYVGRFFKTRNGYGSGKKWWLYAEVTDVDRWASLEGWRFELRSDGTACVEAREKSLYVYNTEWKEVSATEFWEAFHTLQAHVAAYEKPVGTLRRRRNAADTEKGR